MKAGHRRCAKTELVPNSLDSFWQQLSPALAISFALWVATLDRVCYHDGLVLDAQNGPGHFGIHPVKVFANAGTLVA